jgi:hypothetical protein
LQIQRDIVLAPKGASVYIGAVKRTNPVLLCILALAIPAMLGFDSAQASHGVNDQAGLFSSSAVRQAEHEMDQIYRRFNKDVLVETFAGVPDARQAEYDRNREAFFSSFLQERANSNRVNGIYMMIVKEGPPHGVRVQVGAGRATRARLFQRGDQDEVVKTAKADLHGRDYDRALLDSVSSIEKAFQRNSTGSYGMSQVPARRISSSGSIMPFLLIGGLVVVGILVISTLIRAIGGGFGGGRGGVPGVGGGGGGFLSGLFGGIAGAMAGSWLYDRFFGERPSVDNTWTTADSTGSDVGTDFASSGADADDSSIQPEADFGGSGGDSGDSFGDFGGGDSGGADV